MERLIIVLLGYLIGSFQTAIVLARGKGVDIRSQGSGNAGTTNALRVFGKKTAALVFLGDMTKAIFAILLATLLFQNSGIEPILIGLYSGIGAILGHNWPIYFQFKGGKGIAVSISTLVMIDYRIGLISAVLFLLSVFITKYVSLGSLLITISAPITFMFLYKGRPYFLEGLISISIIPLLAIYQHRENIKRLFKGTESKLGEKTSKESKI